MHARVPHLRDACEPGSQLITATQHKRCRPTNHIAVCRDVKLENIFVAGDGSVRLGDFGLTMSMKQELAISPVGTVEYMAPEVRGERWLQRFSRGPQSSTACCSA